MFNLRLKTDSEIESKLIELQNGLQLSSKAAVMRIAIGISLNKYGDPRETENLGSYDIKDKEGGDYFRYTIFPANEYLYKLLFQEKLLKNISDDAFFPELTYAHIFRGVTLLYSDFRLYRNKNTLFKKLFLGE